MSITATLNSLQLMYFSRDFVAIVAVRYLNIYVYIIFIFISPLIDVYISQTTDEHFHPNYNIIAVIILSRATRLIIIIIVFVVVIDLFVVATRRKSDGSSLSGSSCSRVPYI